MPWSDFAVPILESGAGGLAQMQGARERDAQRQRASMGYASVIRGLAKNNPALAPFADAAEANPDIAAQLYESVAGMMPNLSKVADVQAQAKELVSLINTKLPFEKNPENQALMRSMIAQLSGPNPQPALVEKGFSMFGMKDPAEKALSADDAILARGMGLDPEHPESWGAGHSMGFEQKKRALTPLPPFMQVMADPSNPTRPVLVHAKRDLGGGVGPATAEPITGAAFKDTEDLRRTEFSARYLLAHPEVTDPAVVEAAWEASKVKPKLLSGENAAAALAVGLPLDQNQPQWKQPGATDKWQKKLDEYLSGKKSSKLTNADQIAVAGSLHLPLDPSTWTSDQEAKWIAESPKLLGNMAAIKKGPGATTPWWTGKGWKSLPKGISPTDPTWRKNAPKVDEAISKGYITKNLAGETYGIDKKTGLAYDLAQQKPDGLIAIMEPRPDLAARKQTMLDQTKISGAQWAGGPGGHIVARGIDGARYQLSYDKANDRYVWEPWTGK